MSTCNISCSPFHHSSIFNASECLHSDTCRSFVTFELRTQLYKIGVPILVALCLLSIVANGYVMMTVRYLTRSPSPTLFFTLSLTVADAWVCSAMAVSFVLQSYMPYVLNIEVPNSICLGLAYEAIRMGAMITSVLHLLLLAFNHYAGIARPLHYQSTVTPELALTLITVVWIVPPSAFLLFFSFVPNQAFRSTQCQEVGFFGGITFRAIVSSTIFAPLLLMFVIYARIFVLIAKTKRRNCILKKGVICAATMRKRAKNVKASVTTGLIMGTFVIGWTPSVFIFLFICRDCLFDLNYFRSESGQILMFYFAFCSNILIVLKSLVDPIIYASRVKDIKVALYTMHPMCFGRDKLIRTLEKMDRTHMNVRQMNSSSLMQACREMELKRSRQHSLLHANSVNTNRSYLSNSDCRRSGLHSATNFATNL